MMIQEVAEMGRGADPRATVTAFHDGIEHRYCLYISGNTPHSQQYIDTVRAICRKHLGNACNFEVVDVFEDPDRAEADKIYVTPTLIRYLPAPPRRIVGDFSSEDGLAANMGLIR